jgi:plastocyanin
MTKKGLGIGALVLLAGVLGACDDDDDDNVQVARIDGGIDAAVVVTDGAAGAVADATVGQFVITIANFTFSPDNLTVPAGASVIVRNQDTAPHSVTSQARQGDFVAGAVSGVSFDTGAFSSGERTITIAAGAASGTVIPYFCKVHTSGMRNNGQITVK